MTEQEVAKVHERLKLAMKKFVEQLRLAKGPKGQAFVIEKTARKLGPGWSESSVRTCMGLKARAKSSPGQLPRLDALVRFCEKSNVSTEWLLTGAGPRHRLTRQHGGTLTQEALSRELAAHMITACAPLYAKNESLRCEAAELLRVVTDYVVTQATLDVAEQEAWELDEAAFDHTFAAVGSMGKSEEVINALYFLGRRLQKTSPPGKRIPISPTRRH